MFEWMTKQTGKANESDVQWQSSNDIIPIHLCF